METNYYTTYLKAYLVDIDNPLKDDEDFIGSECFKNHLGYLTDEYKALVEGKDTEEEKEKTETKEG